MEDSTRFYRKWRTTCYLRQRDQLGSSKVFLLIAIYVVVKQNLCIILLSCPITKLLWWNSSWQIHLEAFQRMEENQWISLVMGNDNPFLVTEAKKHKMGIFMTIACEQLWLTRNKIRLGGPTLDWRELSNTVNKLSFTYQRITLAKLPTGYLKKQNSQISK